MQHIAELVSLALTIPTIVLAFKVLQLWGKNAIDIIKIGPTTASEWFILGVFFGFVGSMFDNIYWSIPWSSSYLGLHHKEILMNMGVYFNIFFRQMLGILAAYCHIRSAYTYTDTKIEYKNLNNLLTLSVIFGILYCVLLYSIKS